MNLKKYKKIYEFSSSVYLLILLICLIAFRVPYNKTDYDKIIPVFANIFITFPILIITALNFLSLNKNNLKTKIVSLILEIINLSIHILLWGKLILEANKDRFFTIGIMYISLVIIVAIIIILKVIDFGNKNVGEENEVQ